MTAAQDTLAALAPAVDHFRKATASYGAQLFYCYDVPDLPPTNNALEQCFGSARYHERRATGRKGASPGLVVRGAARLVAALATRSRAFADADLRPTDLAAWRTLRSQLQARQDARRAQRRFRHDPAAYLSALEQQLSQPTLPPEKKTVGATERDEAARAAWRAEIAGWSLADVVVLAEMGANVGLTPTHARAPRNEPAYAQAPATTGPTTPRWRC